MHPILTLTINPAVDVCSSVQRVLPVHKLRCGEARRDAGGGGINVARVARRFGSDPIAIYPAGGPVGQLLDREISAENVSHVSVPVAGDTREDFTVNETGSGLQYRFVLPGPHLQAGEIKAVLESLAMNLSPSAFLVASGSLPPGVPVDFYATVAKLAANSEAKFVLDSSGAALQAALGCGVFLIKPSLREFGELLGREPQTRQDCLAAARELAAEGACQFVALSLGKEGAMLVGNDQALFAAAPAVEAVSTVGAGDSFLGALIWALAADKSQDEALALAVAAGSAALLSPGTGLCQVENVERLKGCIRIERL